MDAGTIFYIIAMVIYLVYTALKQRKAGQEQGNMPSEDVDVPQGPRRGTFEDLLREIRDGQKEREREFQLPQEEKVYDVEPPQPTSRPNLSPPPQEERYNNVYDRYQRKQPLVKLDDQVDIYDDRKILGSVASESETTSANRYGKFLNSPKKMREAVILSEILNRKHF